MTLWTPPRSLAIPSGGNGGCGVFADADIIHVGNPAGLWPKVPGVWFLVDVAKKKIHKAIDSAAVEWYSRRFSSFTYNEAPFGDYLFPQTTIRYRDTKIIGSKEDVFNDGTNYRATQINDTIIAVWVDSSQFKLRRSGDRGDSFASQIAFGASHLSGSYLRPIVSSSGKLILFSTDAGGYDIYCYVSTDDGVSWSLASSLTSSPRLGFVAGAVVDGSNIYAITNSDGNWSRLVVSSDDGATLSFVGGVYSVTPFSGSPVNIAKVGSLFVAITGSNIWSSSDLQTWTNRSSSGTSSCVIYGGFVYRVKAGSRKIERTSDFSAWSDFSEIRTVPASGLTPYAGSVKAVLSREDGVFTSFS
jgi:hypothetical protein